MSRRASYIKETKGNFYARRRISEKVLSAARMLGLDRDHPEYRKGYRLRSLGQDRAKAKTKLHEVLADWSREDERVLRQAGAHKPSEHEWVEAVTLDHSLVVSDLEDTLPDYLDFVLAGAEKAYRERRAEHFYAATMDLIQRRGWKLTPDDPEYDKLAMEVGRAMTEAMRVAKRRISGEISAESTDPVFKTINPDKPPKSLRQLFEDYRRQRAPKLSEETIRVNEMALRAYLLHVGERSGVTALTRETAREWRNLLLDAPSAFLKRPGKTLKEVVERGKRAKAPTISPGMVNHYVYRMSAFARWLQREGHIEVNPFPDLAIDASKSARRGFTEDEIKALVCSKPFQPNTPRNDLWKRWAILIGMFSGMRLHEILQLDIADIREIDGQWVFDVNDNGPDKSLKKVHSARMVPVHSKLRALGIIQFANRQRQSGARKLFSTLTPNKRGKYAQKYSEYLMRVIRSAGIKDGAVVFHSLRHTVADRLRAAGWDETAIALILGHVDGGPIVTKTYGKRRVDRLNERVEIIEDIQYPEIEQLVLVG